MITDSDTNIVYFSALLESDTRFLGVYKRITDILDRNHVKYDLLNGTKDIWARDYMPIQLDVNSFVQFRYEPSYLKNDLQFQSDPKVVYPANNLNPVYSDINLDGGNVVKWKDKVIISTRVFKENISYEKTKLIDEIERLLEAWVILIPDIHPPYDLTGHADGYVRFLNEKTILVNEIKNNEYKYWKDGFQKMVKLHGLDYIEVPWFEYKEKDYPNSAIGLYLNYLEIGDLIILPVFDVKGNLDQKVIDLFKSVFPYKQIETVVINQVAREGGLMNCISWNIKI